MQEEKRNIVIAENYSVEGFLSLFFFFLGINSPFSVHGEGLSGDLQTKDLIQRRLATKEDIG